LADLGTEVEDALETIREITTISASSSVGYYEVQRHEQWFVKDAQNY
jgi:hypothetical protein